MTISGSSLIMSQQSTSDQCFQPIGLAAYRSSAIEGGGQTAALLEELLTRIRLLEPVLQSLVCIDTTGARKRAAELDELIADGGRPLPLHGIPVVVKEIFSVDGMPNSAASALSAQLQFEPEGAFIKRLRALGCIILGKSISTEFAFAQYNLSRQMPANPSGLPDRYITGGSSAGSAAAQAAGFCGFAVGTDTGGSVRAPAALCGVVGFKPTTGRWSTDGVFPLSRLLDTPGIFTTSVLDAMMVTAAFDEASVTAPASLDGLRIGVPQLPFFADLDEPVQVAIDRSFKLLEGAGVVLVPLDFPDLGAIQRYYAVDLPCELIDRLGREFVIEQAELLDPLTRLRFEKVLSAVRHSYAVKDLPILQEQVAATMRAANVASWLAPTVPCVAADESNLQCVEKQLLWQAFVSRNTRCVNALGMTACTLPLAVGAGELPVGLQIAGLAGTDTAILSRAAAMESVFKANAAPH
jgi:aspartyl-tRNA(Asn)/glutamyl-tRNA(Gln) amidotransferase subunit A